MTTTLNDDLPRRFYFNWIPNLFLRPISAFNKIITRAGNVWFTPLFILSITTIGRELVSGWLTQQAALMGELPLPPDFQYYSPEQQAQFMQAIQSTQSPVFMYILPIMAGLVGLWIGWIITGSLIHLTQTLLGGRTEISTTLTVVAWASLPFLLRDVVRICYMLITRNLIQYPGLSGLLPLDSEGAAIFLSKFLARIDLYLIWYIVLIFIGVRYVSKMSVGKTTFGILLTLLVILTFEALLSYLISSLGGLTVIRPFYF